MAYGSRKSRRETRDDMSHTISQAQSWGGGGGSFAPEGPPSWPGGTKSQRNCFKVVATSLVDGQHPAFSPVSVDTSRETSESSLFHQKVHSSHSSRLFGVVRPAVAKSLVPVPVRLSSTVSVFTVLEQRVFSRTELPAKAVVDSDKDVVDGDVSGRCLDAYSPREMGTVDRQV